MAGNKLSVFQTAKIIILSASYMILAVSCFDIIKASPFNYLLFFIWPRMTYEEKTTRSDSVLWQKPLNPKKNPKTNVTTHKRQQKLR